uniref:Uncharacterized protein n=1 Tax=Arundo donax TaxID=35708 RepID=A0A0A9ATE5_ARUDO
MGTPPAFETTSGRNSGSSSGFSSGLSAVCASSLPRNFPPVPLRRRSARACRDGTLLAAPLPTWRSLRFCM